MYLIVLLGLLLRFCFISKPEGLWNDEYVSWYISSIPFGKGFLQGIIEQCHMPLYYFYLKIFANFSDTILRISSVIPGVISIWIMYLAGREYSKKTGIYAGLITSVLSFLIYYSQEVRFYSLLFLFSALSILFTIKILKNFSKQNFVCWFISLSLILFTHVLGIIYVFFNVIYILYKRKKMSLKLIGLFCFAGLVTIPFGINILKMLPQSQWWGNFSYTNILFLFTDFYSPILTNNVNAPPVFFYDTKLIGWMLIPTLIGLAGFIKGIEKNKGFCGIALGTIGIMSLLAISHVIVFITKYSIEILPIFILLTSVGFTKYKKAGIILLSVFIAYHLLAFFSPYYSTKIPRNEGHNLVGIILSARKSDNILFTYYAPDRFERYVDLNGKNTLYISKINRFEYLSNPEKILSEIKSGDVVSVVFLDSVSFFNEDQIEQYKDRAPEMFITFSKIRNGLMKELNTKYKDYKVDRLGYWTVITAKKK